MTRVTRIHFSYLQVIIVATVLSCILKIPNEEAGDIEDEENDLILTSFAHVPDSSCKHLNLILFPFRWVV